MSDNDNNESSDNENSDNKNSDNKNSDNENSDNANSDNENSDNENISELIELDDTFTEKVSKEEILRKEDRITRPFLTKYELVRIIGTRRKQLSLGAKPMIKIEGNLSINEIVEEEIKNNMIPFKIKRPLPDSNKIEIWDFSELKKDHLLN